jgi:phage/plasmid primase-like uncharacterized protein
MSAFKARVLVIIHKIKANMQLVKTIQCRNSYERHIVHSMAETHGLDHKKILMSGLQHKLPYPGYNGKGKRLCRWYQDNRPDVIFGVQLSSPLCQRQEPEQRRKAAREILQAFLMDDIAQLICRKL